MLNIEVGALYDVTMRGESEFGGPLRVTSINQQNVHAVFEYEGELGESTSVFSRHGDKDGHEFLRYVPEGNDQFPANIVTFKLVADSPVASTSYSGAIESGIKSLENQFRWLERFEFGELTEQEAARIVKRMASLQLTLSKAIKRLAEE